MMCVCSKFTFIQQLIHIPFFSINIILIPHTWCGCIQELSILLGNLTLLYWFVWVVSTFHIYTKYVIKRRKNWRKYKLMGFCPYHRANDVIRYVSLMSSQNVKCNIHVDRPTGFVTKIYDLMTFMRVISECLWSNFKQD